MRTRNLLSIIGLALFLVAGCGQQYWYQEGKTFAECKADRAACRAELQRRANRDQIGDYERRFMEDCMQQRGYRLVPEKKLPLTAKREDSDIPSELSWARGYGVAGNIGD
jgi:hypothetical protein